MIDDYGDGVVRRDAHECVGSERSGRRGGEFACACTEFGDVRCDAQTSGEGGSGLEEFAAAKILFVGRLPTIGVSIDLFAIRGSHLSG